MDQKLLDSWTKFCDQWCNKPSMHNYRPVQMQAMRSRFESIVSDARRVLTLSSETAGYDCQPMMTPYLALMKKII